MSWLTSIFLWVYCMRYSTALFILLAATILFEVLKRTLRAERVFRMIVVLALLSWSLAVSWNTLIGRECVLDNSASSLIPFHSYYVVLTGGERELLRCNFMNVVLFFPAGLLVCALLPKRWQRSKKVLFVVGLFALVSAGIEFCQYHFALGQAEVDDVIHNALGALVGALISAMPIPWTRGKPGNDPHPHGICKT